MSNHTPGPWYVDDSGHITSRSGVLLGRVFSGNGAPQKENAAVIKSAPAMFQTLKTVLPLMEASFLDHQGTANGEVVFSGLEAVREVIAHASGENDELEHRAMFDSQSVADRPDTDATARLFEVAPMLLAACEKLLEGANKNNAVLRREIMEAIGLARSAVSAASGAID